MFGVSVRLKLVFKNFFNSYFFFINGFMTSSCSGCYNLFSESKILKAGTFPLQIKKKKKKKKTGKNTVKRSF